MSELSRRVLHASRHVDVRLDDAALQRGVAQLERRIARKKRIARGSGALAALSVVALLTFALLPESPVQVVTADGSVARFLEPETALAVERQSGDEVVVRLARGGSHFEVTRNRARRYRVRAGEVTIQVLGTSFDVRRRGEQVFVQVDHGAVQVDWRSGSTVLHGGDARWFPARGPSAAHDRRVATQAQPPPLPQQPLRGDSADEDALATGDEPPVVQRGSNERAREAASRPSVSAPSPSQWRALARAGKHQEAFRSLGQARVEDVDGLLLAADAARLSGHPREAAEHLTRLIDRFPRDVRARLAAFTLGRLALHELGEPLLAARSFARAYALDPDGELAEDALSREAEAYDRAGDARRAAQAAQRYLARFPEGTRRKELERYLGPR